jgi:hypothetical protein
MHPNSVCHPEEHGTMEARWNDSVARYVVNDGGHRGNQEVKEQSDASGSVASIESGTTKRPTRYELQEPFNPDALRSHHGCGCRYVEKPGHKGT